MSDLRARARLQDILDQIAGVRDITADLTLAEFDRSWATVRATQHALLIVSEAVKNLPADLKARRPQIPWERIRALGNFLRHEYAAIDNARIWNIVTEQLDPLEAAVRDLLAASDAEEQPVTSAMALRFGRFLGNDQISVSTSSANAIRARSRTEDGKGACGDRAGS
jgi:uncharacterized protein with HEPN domain